MLTAGQGQCSCISQGGLAGAEDTKGKEAEIWMVCSLGPACSRPAHANPVTCGRNIVGPWGLLKETCLI